MQRDVLAALAVDKRLAGRDPDTRRACSGLSDNGTVSGGSG